MGASPFSSFLRVAFLGAALPGSTVLFAGEEPLPVRVDQLVAEKAASMQQTLAAPADDSTFLRRVWLDFAGTIPSAADSRAFFTDDTAGKRARTIDQLIAGTKFPERMAEVFHIQLMERRGDDENWKGYLADAFRANKPWDQITREILSPDFKNEQLRGAGYFITRRLEKEGQQETDYPGLTRDAGRLFLGVDLQCCQCHRHLTVRDYKQVDFSGLFAVFQNVQLNEPTGEYRTRWVSEGLMQKKFEFTSVLSGTRGETGPRVPLGVEIDIPAMPEDGPWLVMPESNNGAGIPKFSPLKELAAHLVAPDNPLFARNIVNRIWRQLMGRGLVEPLDLHHSGNPASHPELLEMLASEFVGHNFDIRWLVRELALTETFQRAGTLSGEAAYPPDDLFAVAIERPLSAEQLARAFLAATGEDRRVIDERGWDGIEGERYTAAEFEKAFLGAFGNAPKEPELEVKPSLKAALFLRNNELVLSCLKRRPGNLVDRVSGMTDAAQIAEELYLSILTRLPTEEEKLEVAAYLTHHAKERERSLGDYAWAMLSSIEFFTNH